MAEDKAEEPAGTQPSDEIYALAGGLRETARWIAAAFAGIPSLAVISALIRAPGDAGFDSAALIAGVFLAALGAVIGIYAFADVLKPTGTSDDDLTVSVAVMKALPEARFASFPALRQALEEVRDQVGAKRATTSDAEGRKEAAEAEAVQAEAASAALEALLKESDPAPADLVAEARDARAHARDLRALAGVAAGEAAIETNDLALAEQRLKSLEALRRAAYGVQIGQTVRTRYGTALDFGVIAVLLVAAGVICLALAPEPKVETVTAELVTLELEEPGQTALGCQEKSVSALRVGGDDETSDVIVLPGGPCPVKAVKFVTKKPDAFGKVTVVEPVKAK